MIYKTMEKKHLEKITNDIKGAVIFAAIFAIICLSSLIAEPLIWKLTAHISFTLEDEMNPLLGIIFGLFIFLFYPFVQIILTVILAIFTARRTNNKYLLQLFNSTAVALKILIITLIFDISFNLAADTVINHFDYSSKFGDWLLYYNLFIAPSPKFFIIFLISAIRNNHKQTS